MTVYRTKLTLFYFSRQLIEIDFLNRKIELVHNDSIANKTDFVLFQLSAN